MGDYIKLSYNDAILIKAVLMTLIEVYEDIIEKDPAMSEIFYSDIKRFNEIVEKIKMQQ